MSKRDSVKEGILEMLRNSREPVSSDKLRQALASGRGSGKRIQQCLSQLVTAGEAVRKGKGLYTIGVPEDMVTGLLSVGRSGAGFVDLENGESVYVARDHMGTSLPGDRVTVCLEPKKRGKGGKLHSRREGRIVRVEDRLSRNVVGTLLSTGRFFYVVPLNPSYHRDFYVSDTHGAGVGDRVIVRFTDWTNKHVNPEGEIVEVLGPADDPSIDTLSIIRDYELPGEFPPAVIEDAELAGNRMADVEQREDLRDAYVLTIDPERARDFDDALSVGRDAAGNRVLAVHIADVAHFVQLGSPLDKEARIRGNSVYLPDKVIPMLPEQLSNGLCSLKPDEDRLAFSAFLTLDSKGVVIKRRFARTVIRSRKRLTYEQAMAEIEKFNGDGRGGGNSTSKNAQPAETIELLRELHKISREMRKLRFDRHALDLDIPECEIVMDESGRMTGIRPVKNDESHQLIEECMIAANEQVALELQEKNIPLLYRVHEAPSPEKMEDLVAALVGMDYQPGDLSKRSNMSAFLKSIADDPLAHHARVAVLKSMKRAVYSEAQDEHFGLAKQSYAHFTSPIRRYPDLVVHRQLASLLTRTRAAYGGTELKAIAVQSSATEQVADQAERALIEIKKIRFLEAQVADQKPEVYNAVVATVTNFGLFVELIDLQIQGLIHIADLSDRYVRFSRRSNSLHVGKEVYQVGRRVKVYVSRVDFNQRRIDFMLA